MPRYCNTHGGQDEADGQRYVELMWKKIAGGKIRVWVPDKPEMLPENFYLLFVVEERTNTAGGTVRVPSVKGRFVKVTF